MPLDITNLQTEIASRVAAIDSNTKPVDLLTLSKTVDQLFVLEQPDNYLPVGTQMVTQVSTHIVESTQDLELSPYTTEVKITAQAGGGDGGQVQGPSSTSYGAGGGGGSGAYVKDFPVGFVAGGSLHIEKGGTIQVGNLTIESGQQPATNTGSRSTVTEGGAGGRVLFQGLPVPESADSVVYGLKGGDSGTSSLPAESPSNLLNGNSYGQSSSNFHNTYGGSGGAGAPSYLADGGDGSNSYDGYSPNPSSMGGQGYGAGAGGNGARTNNQPPAAVAQGGDSSPVTVEVTVVAPASALSAQQSSKTFSTEVLELSASALAVPANCTGNAFVTMGGAGGWCPSNGSSSNVGGGGSGAYVKDFPIGVNPGGTLNVVVGNTQKVGDLTVEAGGNGSTGAGVSTTQEGGRGGRVIYQGIPQPNSDSVINGVQGGRSGTNASSAEDGGDTGGYVGGVGSNSTNASYGGAGGGGAASYGGDGGDGSTTYLNQALTPNPLPNGVGHGGDGGQNAGSSKAGGSHTPVTIKFEIEG